MLKPGGAKIKGSGFERKVAERLRHFGIEAKRMPLSGADSHLKGDIYAPGFPYAIECKKQETFKLWAFWEQAVAQAFGLRKPLLVHSANDRPVMVTMAIETFLELYRENKDLRDELKVD